MLVTLILTLAQTSSRTFLKNETNEKRGGNLASQPVGTQEFTQVRQGSARPLESFSDTLSLPEPEPPQLGSGRGFGGNTRLQSIPLLAGWFFICDGL